MRNSGVRIDHVAGDRAYYNKVEDRVVLPERSQFPTQDAYTHTALHELGHATGHPSRLDRSTLTKHGGFGSETYAREELRAEIAAMMSGEKLGVGHEPRHGTAYVASWVQALKDDQREIRAACVDAQRASDWLLSRERQRVVEQEKEAPREAAGDREGKARTPAREMVPEAAELLPAGVGVDRLGGGSQDLQGREPVSREIPKKTVIDRPLEPSMETYEEAAGRRRRENQSAAVAGLVSRAARGSHNLLARFH